MGRLKSDLLIALVAVLGLALTASPALGNSGPEYFVNPNNNADDTPWGEDTPWVEFIERPGNDAWVGPQYMVMNIGYWVVEAGLVGSDDNSQMQYPDSGSRERNTDRELPGY